MYHSRASSFFIQLTALVVALLNAGLGALRPLVLASFLGEVGEANASNFVAGFVQRAASMSGVEYFTVALATLAALELLSCGAAVWGDILILKLGTREGRKLRANIARRVLHAMNSRRNQEIVNAYVSRVRADVDVVEQYQKTSLIPSFAALIQTMLSILFAATLSSAIAGVLVLEVIFILLIVFLYSPLHARLALERLKAEERLGTGAQLYMRSALATWFGGLGSLWFRRRLSDAKALARARFRYGIGAAVYHNLTSFALGAFVVLGGIFILRGSNSAAIGENFFILILYSGFLLGPVIRLTSFVPETREYKTALARVVETEKAASAPRPYHSMLATLSSLAITSTFGRMSEQKGDDDHKPRSWTLHSGEKVALVGESGSGKTTLLEVLLGARESAGASAVMADMATTALSHLLPSLGVVYLAEAPTFESGTIEQNGLSYSLESVRLLRAVGLVERDDESANFLGRLIDRNGEPLSLGERQRVQLVRSLLRRPKLVFMDEALSGIGEDAEIAIVKWLLSEQLRDATVLYVSHRPAVQTLFPTRASSDA
jgi:ABC-type transport system involved in cytochrome bd biosynthesis fused ATPase/permease subunit